MKFVVQHTDNPGPSAQTQTYFLEVDNVKQAYNWCAQQWGGFGSGKPEVGGTTCFNTNSGNNFIDLRSKQNV